MRGFADVDEYDVLTSTEVAERMGRPTWSALARYLRKAGLSRPPKIQGSHKFRGRDLKAWFSALPCETDQPAQSRVTPHHHRSVGPAVIMGAERLGALDPDELARRRILAAAR